MPEHVCIDCIKDPPPGRNRRAIVTDAGQPSRCATHQRAFSTRQRKQSRARAVERTYGISDQDNHALFLLQGGRCWLCRKATGATKSLAVDHDHATGEVRGRLCGPCNQFIGKLGDDPEAARRLVAYLSGDTPYRRLKAQQTLESASAPGVSVTIIQVVADSCGWIYADWKWSDRQDKLSNRTIVRDPAGLWAVRT